MKKFAWRKCRKIFFEVTFFSFENFCHHFTWWHSLRKFPMCNLHWCCIWTAVLSASQNQALFSCILLLGSFRLDYEYKSEYEKDFSILVFRLHIITSHTHFMPWSTLYPQPTCRTRTLATSLVWNSRIVLILNLVIVVQSKAPYCHYSCHWEQSFGRQFWCM